MQESILSGLRRDVTDNPGAQSLVAYAQEAFRDGLEPDLGNDHFSIIRECLKAEPFDTQLLSGLALKCIGLQSTNHEPRMNQLMQSSTGLSEYGYFHKETGMPLFGESKLGIWQYFDNIKWPNRFSPGEFFSIGPAYIMQYPVRLEHFQNFIEGYALGRSDIAPHKWLDEIDGFAVPHCPKSAETFATLHGAEIPGRLELLTVDTRSLDIHHLGLPELASDGNPQSEHGRILFYPPSTSSENFPRGCHALFRLIKRL